MRIVIRTKDIKLFLPIPFCAAGLAIRAVPQRALADMRESIPPSCRMMLTKENLYMLYRECRLILCRYRGLEILHVEAADGTYVSIKL